MNFVTVQAAHFFGSSQILAMSETVDQEYPSDYTGDQTQPTADILSALNSLKSEPPLEVPTPTEYDAFTAQAKEKPHNPEIWRRLIDVAENTGEIEKIRAAFDALLQQYPNTVCDTSASLTLC